MSSCFVSPTNRTPNTTASSTYHVIRALPIVVGVPFVLTYLRRTLLNWIILFYDSNCNRFDLFETTLFSLLDRETTYCALSMFFFSIGIMQISLSHHRSLELFSVFSVALLLFCRGTWLVKLVENLGLRPPLLLFRRHSRGALWYDLCYRRTVVSSK